MYVIYVVEIVELHFGLVESYKDIYKYTRCRASGEIPYKCRVLIRDRVTE